MEISPNLRLIKGYQFSTANGRFTSERDGSGSDVAGELTTLYNPSNQAKTKRRTPRCPRQAFQYGCLMSQALRKGAEKSSYRIHWQFAPKETWRAGCLPVCRDGGTGCLGGPCQGSPGAPPFATCPSLLFNKFVLVVAQDRISALERDQVLKVGTRQGQNDVPSPNLKRPDLSRQYTVVLDDKPATPSGPSPTSQSL